MALRRHSETPVNTEPSGDDLFVHVDVSDTTDHADGSSKHATLSSILRDATIFASTDLDGSGDIVITHNKNYKYPQVTVVDENGVKKEGYKVTYNDANELTLRIIGVGAFTGWRAEIA